MYSPDLRSPQVLLLLIRPHTGTEEPAGRMLAEKGRYLGEMTGVPVKTMLIESIGGRYSR